MKQSLGSSGRLLSLRSGMKRCTVYLVEDLAFFVAARRIQYCNGIMSRHCNEIHRELYRSNLLRTDGKSVSAETRASACCPSLSVPPRISL